MYTWLIDVHAVCMISSDFHIFSIPSSKKWSGQCDEWVGKTVLGECCMLPQHANVVG